MPPESPVVTKKKLTTIWADLLRPVFVLRNKIPLCSDAFTMRCKDDKDQAKIFSEVTVATHVLINQFIPKFAETLVDLYNKTMQKKESFDVL